MKMLQKIEAEYYIKIGIKDGEVVEVDWMEKAIKGTDDTTVIQNLEKATIFLNLKK